MKESPEQQVLHEKLLPGALSAEGFLGSDSRNPADIIQADEAAVARLGTSHAAMASRMRELTEAGKAGLGRPVTVGGQLEVTVMDAMGTIACPFSDNYRADKQITRVVNLATGHATSWSDLNIHMIEKHAFYEGRGSFFRVDPDWLANVLNLAGR